MPKRRMPKPRKSSTGKLNLLTSPAQLNVPTPPAHLNLLPTDVLARVFFELKDVTVDFPNLPYECLVRSCKLFHISNVPVDVNLMDSDMARKMVQVARHYSFRDVTVTDLFIGCCVDILKRGNVPIDILRVTLGYTDNEAVPLASFIRGGQVRVLYLSFRLLEDESMEMPCFTNCGALTHLFIYGFDGRSLAGLEGLVGLRQLRLDTCPGIENISDVVDKMPCLNDLILENCPGLRN
jgi:hypothetical protein